MRENIENKIGKNGQTELDLFSDEKIETKSDNGFGGFHNKEEREEIASKYGKTTPEDISKFFNIDGINYHVEPDGEMEEVEKWSAAELEKVLNDLDKKYPYAKFFHDLVKYKENGIYSFSGEDMNLEGLDKYISDQNDLENPNSNKQRPGFEND